MRVSESRVKLLMAERKPLLDEAEFYVGKPLPTKLKSQIDANDAALDAQRTLIANQEVEVGRINAIYDAELVGLRKLWAGAPVGLARHLLPRRFEFGSGAAEGRRHARPLAAAASGQRSFCFSSSPTSGRIGLALARLHGLADERVERLVLAGAELVDRLPVGGDHLVDDAARARRRRSIWRRPRASISASTSTDRAAASDQSVVEHLRAALFETVPIGDAPDRRPSAPGATGDASIAMPATFRRRESSPIIQLATSFAGGAAGSARSFGTAFSAASK